MDNTFVNDQSTNDVSNYRSPVAPQEPETSKNEGIHVKQGPGPEVWETYRPIVKRLYLDEDKTLKDVMAIMQREYGHKATVKMYKSRIEKWGLDKNCKASEMRAIARKKVERDAIGKASSFRIRTRPIEVEQVLRHFKRKSYHSLEDLVVREKFPRPETPSCIEVSTPGASDASPRSDDAHFVDSASMIVGESQFIRDQTQPQQTPGSDGRKIDPAHPSSDLVSRQLLRRNASLRRLSFLSRISPSPEPPRDLLIPERLFLATKMLLQNCGDRDLWTTDGNGALVPRQTARRMRSYHYAIWEFWDHCQNAARLLENGLFVKARQLLSQACERIKDVVEEGHSHTIGSMLGIYLWFKQKGYADAAIQVYKYTRSITMITQSSTGAFYHFIENLLLLDQNVEEVCFTAWKCNIDIFEQHLEPFHDTLLTSRLGYIEAVGWSISWQEAENLLWSLSKQLEQLCGKSDLRCCRVLEALANLHYKQNRFEEAEWVGHDAFQRANHLESTAWKLKSLYMVSKAQYCQDKDDQAKDNLERCINMATVLYGEEHPLNIKYLLRLEQWLISWGQREEASTVAARRIRILGLPEIEEMM